MKIVVSRTYPNLPNHLAELLRSCLILNTTETKALATHLNLSVATVNAYFQRVAETLETTDRFSSVQKASRLGLLVGGDEDILINGDFIEGNLAQSPGSSLPWASLVGWTTLGLGTPQWVVPENGEPGAVKMWGAADTGEAICQYFLPARRPKVGKTYRFSAEYRFGPVRRDWPVTPRQPMFVDFVIRACVWPLAEYAAPDEPGKLVTLGRLHYAPRPPEVILIGPDATEKFVEQRRRVGGEHLVQDSLYTQRVGGNNLWEWESGAFEWTPNGAYNILIIHPTNDLVVGTDGSNKDGPNEIAWGQIRRVRLVEVTPGDAEDAP
jgi:hypothetical protein